jgi:hypothetical protein
MYLEHLRCLTKDESRAECAVMCLKRKLNVNRVVFWLPYKKQIQYDYTNCQQNKIENKNMHVFGKRVFFRKQIKYPK